MSDADREKWDRRYVDGSYEARTYPSPFLTSWLDRFPRGRALDVACGAGRNALALAAAGFDVDGMDISAAALARAAATARERGLAARWLEADLDEAVPEAAAYALITVIRFVNRSLHPRLVDALAPDGWLLYEHHLRTPADVGGPRDPGFRLAPQELLRAFARLRVVHYEEVISDDPDGRRMALARLVACNGDPGF